MRWLRKLISKYKQEKPRFTETQLFWASRKASEIGFNKGFEQGHNRAMKFIQNLSKKEIGRIVLEAQLNQLYYDSHSLESNGG